MTGEVSIGLLGVLGQEVVQEQIAKGEGVTVRGCEALDLSRVMLPLLPKQPQMIQRRGFLATVPIRTDPSVRNEIGAFPMRPTVRLPKL